MNGLKDRVAAEGGYKRWLFEKVQFFKAKNMRSGNDYGLVI